MVKPLLVVAFLAHIFILADCTRNRRYNRSPRDRPFCSANEVWVKCPEAVCAAKTCEDVGFPIPCYDLLPDGECPSRPCCICKEGFVRNHRGVCIPPEYCPSCGGDRNARPGCGINCNRLCSNYNQTDVICTEECNYNACDCKKGFVFDEIRRKCVRPHQCIPEIKCTKRNEVFDLCPAPCPLRTCGINDAAVSCVPALPVGHPNCPPPACRCRDGYYRNHRGHCVLWEHCPKCKRPNEVYDPCPAPCPPRTCDVNEALILCEVPPQLGSSKCRPGCRCADGFVKNESKICIPKEECPPSCNGDSNAVSGCGVYCNKRCRDIGNETDTCLFIKICHPDSCDCHPDYYLDENIGKCVLPEQCSPQCPLNERHSSCIQGDCRPQECSKIGTSLPCPMVDSRSCEKGCLCKEGYFRNENGICVPEEECPPKCPVNEEYNTCIQGDCRPHNCSQLGNSLSCPRVNPEYCEKGCLCIEGFVRNDDGVCIPKEKCPACAGDYNKVSGCGVYCNQRCSDIGNEPGACIEICYDNACNCQEGYFLDENTGFCVKPEECSPQCSLNEIYSTCIQGECRAQECSEIDTSLSCPRIDPRYCEKGCLCKEGYLRNEDGVCVSEEECPSECPVNEEYSTCIQGDCRPHNCSQLGTSLPCPRIDPRYCKTGCLCIEGFVRRDDDGVCIPKEECPACAGDYNKVSGCGVYCNQRCSDIGNEPGVCIDICYDNACNCREGLFLDEDTGFCVPPQECSTSVQCPVNEEYSTCIQGDCRPHNCSQLGTSLSCPRIDPRHCERGCLCKEGFVRNDDGVCIPKEECPSCGGDKNKVAGCGGYCNQRCRDIDNGPYACKKICEINACNCREGLFLDDNTGFCVPPKQCTPQCPENEWYSECTQGNCSPENCTQVGFPIACPSVDANSCNKGCLCKQDYARNNQGICIPSTECPSCGGDPNAQPGCGGNCNKRCTDIGQEPKACILICEFNGCNCKDGFYFDERIKKCVRPEQCSNPVLQCGENEEYNNCTESYCFAKTCDDLGFPLFCPYTEPKYCTGGCVCKPGLVKNREGICIPSDECPSCGGDPNAKPGCGGNCNKHCYNLGKEPGFCTLSCIQNGCDCKDGYYYDDDAKRCVSPTECPNICPLNEVYSTCTNGGCQARNCSQYGEPVPCIKMDPKFCKKGCVCQENYLRTSNGLCVPQQDCPEACYGPNKEYSDCTWDCPPQTCESLDKAYACPIREGENCKPMCKCKPGFYKDRNGQCLTEDECRKCKGSNEYYACGGACDNVCETYDKQNQDNCPIVNIKCNEMCYCDKGYARARNNTCIPISSCAIDVPVCRKHEVYEDCSNPSCKADYCADIGYPLDCGSSYCRKGCVCEDGYVRDHKGHCIPIEKCPSCGGDPNAVSGCGVNCGKQCSNIGDDGPVACPAICRLNGCDCREGFYYDAKKKKCVRPDQCPLQCPLNERYEKCPGSDCQPQYCKDLGFPGSCYPRSEDEPCSTKPGCLCVDGYVRDYNGKCIPKNECPSCGNDPNAHSGCGVNCGKHCSDLVGSRRPCIRICYPNACDCNDGFYYDSNQNKCVPAEQCTDICPKNEVFEDCSNPICRSKNCTQVGFPIDCKEPCVKGCVCQNGHVRNEKGICIPVNQCPSCGGDYNAQPGCGTNCGRRCPNNYINPRFCPRIACVPQLNKCDCKDGFYYDINTKNCVRKEDCSPLCDESKNEVYDSCVNGGCGWRNCSQVGGPMLCIDPIRCEQGCKCKDGYYRLEDGTCVPEAHCPYSICHDDPNTQPGCGYNCGKRCPNNYINPKLCPRLQCVPNKCDCIDGFYYDVNTKRCVVYDDCTPSCSAINDEVYDPHPPICPPQTCESLTHKYFCPFMNATSESETPGTCRCKPDFYRNKIKECIHRDDCLKCTGPNEYFSCGPECDNVCSKLDTESKNNCPRQNIQCVSKCYCEDEYARDEKGICIPINQCPTYEDRQHTSTTRDPTPSPDFLNNAIAKFERGNQALAGQFLYYLLQSRPGENFMISGFSVLVALAQLTLNATGVTLEQLMRVLNLDSIDEIEAVFPVLIQNYKAQKEVTFELAVKYYSSINYPFAQRFKQTSKTVFDAELQSLDFSQNVQAADTINRWVEDNTNGLIKNLVNANMFGQYTRCVLVNALYFLGNWEKQFDKVNTKPRDFYFDKDNTVSIDTMYQDGRFEYAESDDLGCQILKLPYKRGNFSFWVYLPKERFGLQSMVEKLLKPDNFAKSMTLLSRKKVHVYLPVIDFDTNISDLPDLLRKVNITEPLKPYSNGLKGILENDEPLFISDAIQKTKIKVNEKGTEAAAATAIMVGTTSAMYPPPEVYTVDCNHPFVFLLQLGNFPMFYGTYSGRS